jgi:hypothetical protein
MLSFDLPPLGLMVFWTLFSRSDRGCPTLHGWWARHTALYIEVGPAGSRYEVHPQPPLPTDIPRSRSERGAASDGKPPPSPLRHRLHCVDSHLHRTSLPVRRWHQRTRRPPALRPSPPLLPLRPLMVCDPILHLSLFPSLTRSRRGTRIY